ncbi:MAG: hypothetical protein O2983_11255 [Planctomycetota bacterium]|nr:hypothetical protein [Planctomycetota bacterium]MDA0918468.1 hypothetical protein [Planctomycetota bacterium]MDA1160179.1 hypothetical protein [Planctomycetota bacterium]
MRFLVRIFAPGVFFSLVCGTFVGIRSAETVTVIPAGGKAAELVFAELLTVALGNRSELKVVERSGIKDVLQEQRISAFGERSDSLLLGHLLGVDLFVVWEDHSENGQSQQKFSGRLVCFDGATGVRLGDTVMAGQDPMEMAERACKHIVTAVSKRVSMDKQGLRLLSIASIRNVDVQHSLRDQFPGLVRSIEGAFAEHPEAALLERDRLRFVMRERNLPVARKQARLLAAAHALTIEFAQSGGVVKTIVRLHHNDRPRPVEAEWLSPNGSDPTAATRAISQVFSQIKFARRESTGARDTAAEAELLNIEATRLSREGNSLGAAVRMEAAVLLEETGLRLTYLDQWLTTAVLQRLKESLQETGGTMAGVSYAPSGELRSKWSFPDDAWVEAIQIADYRLLIADRAS